MGLKLRDYMYLLETGQAAFLWKFVETTGDDTQKMNDSVLNGMCSIPYPKVYLHSLNSSAV